MKTKAGYSLDIYGPIGKDFKKEFFNKINNNENIIYKGILNQGEIISSLNKYDALLFRTHYKGEGFPGTILEALMAGVPVIASDWKYNSEIIENGKTGLIHKNNSPESIANCIEFINNNFEKYKNMPINCIHKAEELSEEKITKILFEIIDK